MVTTTSFVNVHRAEAKKGGSKYLKSLGCRLVFNKGLRKMNKILLFSFLSFIAVGSVYAMNDPFTLHEAAKSGDAELVEALLLSGADVNQKDDIGRTPLNCAIHGPLNGSLKQAAVEKLLEHGADVNLRDSLGKLA